MIARFRKLRALARNTSGATSIEYAMIAILISVGIVGMATLVGNNANTTFNSLAATVDTQ